MDSDSGTTKKNDGKDQVEEETATAAPPSTTDTASDDVPPASVGRTTDTDTTLPTRTHDQHMPPNIRDLQPQQRRPGDFDRDLMPGGLDDPTGNLMGPGHPAFGGVQPPTGGGYGMMPRFDPFGPPRGPTDPRNLDPSRNVDPNDPRNPQLPRQPRPPPGGTGDPNPDHERPPNDLNNDMFM